MAYKLYAVVLEVEDRSASDGEDIERYIQEALEEYLPGDLTARVVEFDEADGDAYLLHTAEDY